MFSLNGTALFHRLTHTGNNCLYLWNRKLFKKNYIKFVCGVHFAFEIFRNHYTIYSDRTFTHIT